MVQTRNIRNNGSRVMGGNVRLEHRNGTNFIRYTPVDARSTMDGIMVQSGYNYGQRVIVDANHEICEVGGYRLLPPSARMPKDLVMRQLVDPNGKDIEGAVFPYDKKAMPMSGLGKPIRISNQVGGVKTIAISDLHGEAYRMAQLIFELPEAEKVVVNGDIVDRGPGWWRIYSVLTGFTDLSYNWGNHDAMWFGAGVGNKPLVAELFRWLFRYNEQGPFAEKFGIDFSKLEAFARANFNDAAGSFKAKVTKDKVEVGKMMEAALTQIKLKLEAQERYTMPETPLEDNELRILEALRHKSAIANLTPVDRPLFERLTAEKRFGLDKDQKAKMKELSAKADRTETENNDLENLRGIEKEGEYLLNLVNRMKAADRVLNDAEKEIVDDLTNQLLNSKAYREMTLWFIETGGMYTIADGNLYTHSHYPVDKDGNPRQIDGMVGKEAFDAITARVKKVGAALRVFHETGDRSGLDKVAEDIRWMRFLAWDYESPLYGRVMQTWERAYLKEKSGTYEEPEDPFYALVEPKMPEPSDAKIKKDKKKLKAWQEDAGKVQMEKYAATLQKGRRMIERILQAFSLDAATASFIKGHKPDKGENIGKPIVHYSGGYLNIDAVMSGPAADIEQGYGGILVTTDRGVLIWISIAPQHREVVKEV